MQYENALALRCSLETGMRISDVLSMHTYQLEGRTITYTAQKTKKKDKKVISADLAKRLKQISGVNWIFQGRFGDKPRTRQAVWKDVKKGAKILKLDGNIACHSARKTYAVEEFKDGGLAQVQKDLQHNDVNTTMLYAFADLIDKAPAVKNLDLTENQEKNKKTHSKECEKIENQDKNKEKTAENQTIAIADICRFGELVAQLVFDKIKCFLEN